MIINFLLALKNASAEFFVSLLLVLPIFFEHFYQFSRHFAYLGLGMRCNGTRQTESIVDIWNFGSTPAERKETGLDGANALVIQSVFKQG
jgi:hypothetical protein